MGEHHSASQSRQDTPGVPGNQQFATPLAGEQPAGIKLDRTSSPVLEPLIDLQQVIDHPGDIFPGAHERFGPGIWGISESENYGDFQVENGYYGLFLERPDHSIINDQGERIPVLESDVLWTSNQPDVQSAAIVWQNRAAIETALRSVGFGGRKKIRVRAVVGPETITVSDYDFANTFVPVNVPIDTSANILQTLNTDPRRPGYSPRYGDEDDN